MAYDGKTVSELPEATSLDSEDIMYVVSDGTSKKMTQDNIRNYMKSDELINIRKEHLLNHVDEFPEYHDLIYEFEWIIR